MYSKNIYFFMVIFSLILMVSFSLAQAPQLLNYQGKLNNGGKPATGTFSIMFSIYANATGGTALWTETQNVTITDEDNGVFNILLGSVTSFPSTLFTGTGERYLGMKVGSDSEMTPRFRLSSVVFALRAVLADSAVKSGTGADNDWIISDNNIYSAVSGNVGIGKSNPSQKLEVAGTVQMTGFRLTTGAANGYVLISNSSGVGSWKPTGSGTSLWSASGNNIYYNTGNIGMGTTNPVKKLHIVNFGTSQLRLEQSSTEYADLYKDAAGFGIYMNGSGKVRIYDDGTMGIADWTPDARFEVSADGGASDLFMLSSNDANDGNLLIVKNGGNVGIGTTAPGAPLEIKKTGGFGAVVDLLVLNSNNAGFNGGGALVFKGSGSQTERAKIEATYQGSINGDLRFYTNITSTTVGLTEKMRITPDGNVGIGTTSPNYKLHVNGSAGKPGGGSWSNASDARLKDIKGNFTRGLEAIDKLIPVYFKYKKDNPINLPSDQEYIGLIAQEVQKVIPEAVGKYEKDYLSVTNDPIIWTMLNAIKELKAENAAMKQRIEALEQGLGTN